VSPLKRLHYFDYQFLRARDFTDEQQYHREMLRLHNRELHKWGIARGLVVTAAGSGVHISKGCAFDAAGNLLLLEEDVTRDLAGHAANAPVWITIRYSTRATDPSDESGINDDTRWTEEPEIRALDAAPAAQDEGTVLVLAEALRTGTAITRIEEAGRRRAAVLDEDLRASVNAKMNRAGDTMTGQLTVPTLRFGTGPAAVSAVSTDPKLSKNSDAALPTERAVRAYVDAHAVRIQRGEIEFPPVGTIPPATDPSKRSTVTFQTAFSAPPTVLLGATYLDAGPEATPLRYELTAENVTATGFAIQVRTWTYKDEKGTYLRSIKVSWLAIGPV
jgi:hypothetical protein